jgi:TPR repeat protein
MYHEGMGVPQNDVEAYKWFSIVAAEGNRDVLIGRDSIAKSMTSAQVVEAQSLAREWLKKH